MSCDRVGNLLLAKFSTVGASDVCIQIPANIIFWLLKHLPVNQNPYLQAPPPPPTIDQRDWENPYTPRAFTVNCKEMPGALRMTFNLDRKPDLTIVLDPSNVELMRQVMVLYTKDLIDLDAA
ncbi:hypothetical protein E4O92_06405 [Massilia horti]|uniref:Uncharacterized protein n=2 Tax=Massilia horti TaxID=2562153 RepID=A0A4Y9T223_9BURK|nr:hypothetical protein E4O92_06405 [Massilia horti]